MTDAITLAGVRLTPGTKEIVKIQVTTDLDGGEINLWVHALSGARPGPVLAVTSCLHGSEWSGVDVVQRLVQGVDLADLSGTLLAIPVGNPTSFNTLTRNTPDESDAADLNRVFPGTHTWIAEQLAQTITREVLRQSQYLVDMHPGPWGTAIKATLWAQDLPNPGVMAEIGRMARAFGVEHIWKANVVNVFPGPRSIVGFAGNVLGVKALAVELGGVGFPLEWEDKWNADVVRGIRNVMKTIGMLAGEVAGIPKRYLYFSKTHRVNPTKGGILRPNYGGQDLGRQVTRGEVLGRVLSPYTFEELEVLRSPVNGVLYMVSRPYPVRPGYWSFGVIDTDDPNSRWTE